MTKLNKLDHYPDEIIQNLPCTVSCPYQRIRRSWELQLEPEGRKLLSSDNIYVGQVENIASNIQAAFVRIAPDRKRLSSSLAEWQNRLSISAVRTAESMQPLEPGDEMLVQVSQ